MHFLWSLAYEEDIRRRRALFGVDLSKKFGVSFDLELIAEWNDVCNIYKATCMLNVHNEYMVYNEYILCIEYDVYFLFTVYSLHNVYIAHHVHSV